MKQILIFSENDKVGLELLGGGLSIATATGAEVAVAILGENFSNRAQEYLSRGATTVYVPGAGKTAMEMMTVESYAAAIAKIAKDNPVDLVLVGCTRNGKDLAGRLAQKMDAGCINDVNKLELREGRIVCERYALGGATVSTQTICSPVAVISIMPGTFDSAAVTASAGKIVEVDMELKPSRVRIIERQKKATDAVDIAEATTLVCVGMGLGGVEYLPEVEALAKLLGGEVACSKPVATDQKWLSEARMVGLSGKKCKPQLSLCLGLSGQVQFVVGIREAKTIVVVNTDENASMFQLADYGIVGDLHEVIPKMISFLKQ